MGTFRHKDISAPLRIRHMDVKTGTFWHKDTLARDISARTFDHWDFLCTRTFRHHGHYGTAQRFHGCWLEFESSIIELCVAELQNINFLTNIIDFIGHFVLSRDLTHT